MKKLVDKLKSFIFEDEEKIQRMKMAEADGAYDPEDLDQFWKEDQKRIQKIKENEK